MFIYAQQLKESFPHLIVKQYSLFSTQFMTLSISRSTFEYLEASAFGKENTHHSIKQVVQ
jgi:hypothetical protein